MRNGIASFRSAAAARHERAGYRAARLKPGDLRVVSDVGYNYRMTDIQAAVGSEQLKRLPEIVETRRKLADRYSVLLAALPKWTSSRTAIGRAATGKVSACACQRVATNARSCSDARRRRFARGAESCAAIARTPTAICRCVVALPLSEHGAGSLNPAAALFADDARTGASCDSVARACLA